MFLRRFGGRRYAGRKFLFFCFFLAGTGEKKPESGVFSFLSFFVEGGVLPGGFANTERAVEKVSSLCLIRETANATMTQRLIIV